MAGDYLTEDGTREEVDHTLLDSGVSLTYERRGFDFRCSGVFPESTESKAVELVADYMHMEIVGAGLRPKTIRTTARAAGHGMLVESHGTAGQGRLDDADSLESAVGQAVGFASTCWESLDGTGQFREDKAREITEELVDGIRSGRWPTDDLDDDKPRSIDDDPEMFHGLTIWTDAVSVQVRDGGEVALYVMGDAPRYTGEQHEPVRLSAATARKVRDLLNIATARGEL